MVRKGNDSLNPDHKRAYEKALERLGNITDENNKDGITKFLYYLEHEHSKKLTTMSVAGYLGRTIEIAEYLKDKFLNPTSDNLNEFLRMKNKVRKDEGKDGLSWQSINLYIATMRIFYQWEFGKDAECLKGLIRAPREEKEIEPDDLLSPEEVQQLISATINPRDKALWSLLYDSGCRIGELQTLKIKDLDFNKDYGFSIFVRGKTGGRKVVVMGDSIVHIREWLKAHPFANDKEAYVFCGLNGQNFGKPMTHNLIYYELRSALKRANLNKKVYPHLFRHTRASLLANSIAQAPLEAQMGWKHGSKMTEVYIHLSDAQQEEAIRKMYGIEPKENKIEASKPKECPRCKELNPSNATQCSRCFLPFDIKLVPDSELLGIADDYKRIFREMLFDMLEDEYHDRGDKEKLETLRKIRDSGIDLF